MRTHGRKMKPKQERKEGRGKKREEGWRARGVNSSWKDSLVLKVWGNGNL